VFYKRIIIFFPTVQQFVAKEAGDIIRVDLGWVVEETCFCELCAR
jgi:hypothetical protein